MKKQKLNSLGLNKTSISNLHLHTIKGGDDYTMNYVVCNTPTHPQACNPNLTKKKCGIRATEAYNCTVDSIAMSNCGLTQCQSAGACA